MFSGKIIVAAALVAAVSADVYMHNPRGSNNRLSEFKHHPFAFPPHSYP